MNLYYFTRHFFFAYIPIRIFMSCVCERQHKNVDENKEEKKIWLHKQS